MPTPTSTMRSRAVTVLLATALAIATTIALGADPWARAIGGPVDIVYVATGQNYPDALAASTLAAAQGAPLLLVTRNSVPQATRDALDDLDPNRIVIIGGTATVTNAVRNQLVPYASSGLVQRIAGNSRYATAAEVADALPEVQPNKVYHLNVSSGATVRSSLTSEPLRSTTVFRPAGQGTGHYCVNVPNGLFDVFGTLGVIQSAATTGTAGADVIRVTSTFSGVCQQAGAEIDVRLSNDNGTLANGYFTLMIPGRD